MLTPNLSDKHRQEATEELVFFTLLLAHTNERIATLKPGINCTDKHYRQLMAERLELTLRVHSAKVRSKGYTFAEDKDSLYVHNNIVLVLGGIYRQRVRT